MEDNTVNVNLGDIVGNNIIDFTDQKVDINTLNSSYLQTKEMFANFLLEIFL